MICLRKREVARRKGNHVEQEHEEYAQPASLSNFVEMFLSNQFPGEPQDFLQ